jgi:hypothetical protein
MKSIGTFVLSSTRLNEVDRLRRTLPPSCGSRRKMVSLAFKADLTLDRKRILWESLVSIL